MLNKEKLVEVILDKEKCIKCGVCIESCSGYLTFDEEGFPCANDAEVNILGCFQCGKCMMKCPKDAIEIVGEDIDRNHLRDIAQDLPSYQDLHSLFLKRRSVRRFKPDEISREDIDKILSAASASAVSIPPSEVKVLVIQGRKKVQEMAQDLLLEIKQAQKALNPFVLNLIKLFKGEVQYKLMKEFILPLCEKIVEYSEKGDDKLFYDAPCVMIFYGTELTDVEDMTIAATSATIAAEALNLGTCFIGTLPHFLNNSLKLRKKYEILKGEKVGMAFILGVSDEKHFKAFQRNFKEIRFVK